MLLYIYIDIQSDVVYDIFIYIYIYMTQYASFTNILISEQLLRFWTDHFLLNNYEQ